MASSCGVSPISLKPARVRIEVRRSPSAKAKGRGVGDRQGWRGDAGGNGGGNRREQDRVLLDGAPADKGDAAAGRRQRWKWVNAATGSAKNMTPKREKSRRARRARRSPRQPRRRSAPESAAARPTGAAPRHRRQSPGRRSRQAARWSVPPHNRCRQCARQAAELARSVTCPSGSSCLSSRSPMATQVSPTGPLNTRPDLDCSCPIFRWV